MESRARKSGLLPLCFYSDAEILILGSLPSDESIRKQEYYGNPKNYFWDILSIVFGEAIGQDYESKKEFLRRHHIALWDVIAEARREGSLDSNIKDERYNDIESLLEKSSVKTIVLNGGKAARAFRKYLRENPSVRLYTGKCRILGYTSTSSLSASSGWSEERIANQWKGLLTDETNQ